MFESEALFRLRYDFYQKFNFKELQMYCHLQLALNLSALRSYEKAICKRLSVSYNS